jgi:hypothetical protein
MRRFQSRRGEAIWIAWVMITAFMVAMGAIIYNWSRSYASASAEQVEEKAYREECSDVAISIESACQDNYTLTLTVKNLGRVRVDKIVVNMFDAFGGGLSGEQELPVKPGVSAVYTVLKQGPVYTVKAVPALRKNNKWVVCSEKEAEYSNVEYC